MKALFLAGAAGMLLLGPTARAADELPAVSVSGRIKSVQTLIDRKVYRMSDQIQALTGSAAELLNSLPSVEVDADGNVSLRGDPNVTILIDGKPSSQLSGSRAGDGLLQLSALDIERIEVMTNPPAEFRAAGTGGVINIITRRKVAAGAGGSLQMSAGDHERYLVAASGSYANQDLKLTGAVGLRGEARERLVQSSAAGVGDAGGPYTVSQQSLDEHLHRVIPSARLEGDLKLSERQSISGGLSVRQRDGTRFFDQLSNTQGGDGTPLSTSTRHSDGHEWSRSEDQSLRWRLSNPAAASSLEVWTHRSTDVEHERYTYLDTALLPSAPALTDHLYLNHDMASREWGLDYQSRPDEERTLKLGFARQQDDNVFANAGDSVDPVTGQVLPNPVLTNQFRFRQTVEALYASLQQGWGPWSLLAGLRGERTATLGGQLSMGVSNQRHYGGAYPSLRLERSLDDAVSWSLGYGKRVTRPEGEALNPFIDHQDIHNLRAGNPALLPQETQSLELGRRVEQARESHGFTVYVREARNSVTTLTQLLSPGVTLNTLSNLPLSRSYGLEFNREQTLSPVWSYRISGNAFHTEIDASALGFSGLRATSGLNLKASLDFKPGAADQAQLTFSRADKRLTPQGEIAAINLVNIGYRHQWSPRITIFATLSDVFNGQRFQRQLDTAGLSQTYSRQQLGRVFFLGLSCSFSGTKPAKSPAFDYDKAD